jgi:hypothetical protein
MVDEVGVPSVGGRAPMGRLDSRHWYVSPVRPLSASVVHFVASTLSESALN